MFTNSLQFYYVMLLSVVGILIICAATKPTNILLYSSASHTHRDNTSLNNYPVICSFPVAALGTPKPRRHSYPSAHTIAHCSLIPSNSSYQALSSSTSQSNSIKRLVESQRRKPIAIYPFFISSISCISQTCSSEASKNAPSTSATTMHHHTKVFHFPNTLLLSRQGWVCLLIYFDIYY